MSRNISLRVNIQVHFFDCCKNKISANHKYMSLSSIMSHIMSLGKTEYVFKLKHHESEKRRKKEEL